MNSIKSVDRDGKQVYIATNAVVLGRVKLGAGTSVWFGSVIRGDVANVTIGDEVNIQDMCVVHPETGCDMVIGDLVTLGHGAIVHGDAIGGRTIVGMGARVLAHSKVGSGCVVAAGALVPERAEIPDGSLVVGVPGKILRQVKQEEIDRAVELAQKYHRLAVDHVKNGWAG
ncbi:MAG: gamma carbonic anhydrase family protein [Planctomycetota bacterium]|nr:gamma carbonic anhydrase family protein [Planctomycetota bacterium]